MSHCEANRGREGGERGRGQRRRRRRRRRSGKQKAGKKGLLVYGGRVGEPEVDNMPGSRAPGPPNPPGSGQPPTKYTKK